MPTEKIGYTTREDRDAQIQKLKAAGRKHVNKYTTHEGNDPQILYVVTWQEPEAAAVPKSNESTS
jgi:hypothetical protein